MSFGRLYLSRIGPCYLSYQICGQLFIILLYPFHVRDIRSDVPSFLVIIYNFCLLSFFLACLSIFLIFSKNQFLVLLIFFIHFLFSISWLLLWFYYFFTSAPLGFNLLFFPSFLKWNLRFLILDLSFFLYAFNVFKVYTILRYFYPK